MHLHKFFKHQAECSSKCLLSGSNNNYYALAQNLRQNINDMKIKIDSQLKTLAALKDRVRDQVMEMQRLEVRLCL